jgi:hypothetical protein
MLQYRATSCHRTLHTNHDKQQRHNDKICIQHITEELSLGSNAAACEAIEIRKMKGQVERKRKEGKKDKKHLRV